MALFHHMISTLLTLAALGVLAVVGVILYFSHDIPDYHQLSNYQPPIVTRLYASDGRLLEEYAKEKRVFVPIDAIPKKVIDAFLAAEDRNFYKHPGIDAMSILRAFLQNLLNAGQERSLVGGSTITQQVAKNFLLTRERSITRKIREAILAFRMSSAFTKDKILELYLNEIFLGNGSYGVAVAALNYFNKPLEELTVEEAATLAALPKAPSDYDPRKAPDQALKRRNWVLRGMLEEGMITAEEYRLAVEQPITLGTRDRAEVVSADFFAEEVRRELVRRYGDKVLYEDGLSVRTTLDPAYQAYAEQALRKGLIAYDRKHGWRGPVAKIDITNDWQQALTGVPPPPGILSWNLATVLALDKEKAAIGLKDGSKGAIPLEELKWARKWLEGQRLGPAITQPSQALAIGDVIMVDPMEQDAKTPRKGAHPSYHLRQIPAVNGATIVMNPHTGRVLAMMGGYFYGKSQYNRATQALRQPGSAFKPFVYLSAMEHGFTPASIVEDGPISLPQGPGMPMWTPKNYSNDFLGEITLREALAKSRNLVTVRLAYTLGIRRITEIAQRFGIAENPQPNFSMVLGATETTLLKLTNAYAMIANGGHHVAPTLIEWIQDRNGKVIWRYDARECPLCKVDSMVDVASLQPPVPEEKKVMVADPRSIYQILSMLEDVVKRGTAASAAKLGKPMAGKTGTTNDSLDTWFIGFTPDLVSGTYVGFDAPTSLGAKETGASVALPVFIDFMANALKDKPAVPFKVPAGLHIRIEEAAVEPAEDGEERAVISGIAKDGTPIRSSLKKVPGAEAEPIVGTGGLY